MDPLLRIGHWPIVGRRPVDEDRIPWPTYKVAAAPDAYVVEDHLGRRQRAATSQNIAALRFPTDVAEAEKVEKTSACAVGGRNLAIGNERVIEVDPEDIP
jgi:hypothetical protein